jgi:hypothetical protein
MKKIYLLTFLISLFLVPSCKTAFFDATWTNDTNTWKAYSLNEVGFQIPNELPLLKHNLNLWSFVIKARQSDNFSYGVREAVEVHIISESALSIETAEAHIVKSIEANGGRISSTDNPIKSILYYAPDAIKKPSDNKSSLPDLLVSGSSFGYIFNVRGTNFVQISFFNIDHTSVPYQKWNPEREIFTDEERELIKKIVLSVK